MNRVDMTLSRTDKSYDPQENNQGWSCHESEKINARLASTV